MTRHGPRCRDMMTFSDACLAGEALTRQRWLMALPLARVVLVRAPSSDVRAIALSALRSLGAEASLVPDLRLGLARPVRLSAAFLQLDRQTMTWWIRSPLFAMTSRPHRSACTSRSVPE